MKKIFRAILEELITPKTPQQEAWFWMGAAMCFVILFSIFGIIFSHNHAFEELIKKNKF